MLPNRAKHHMVFLNESKLTLGIFTDLFKPFDTVDHIILKKKEKKENSAGNRQQFQIK